MNIVFDKLCYDMLVVPLQNGILDISWSIDTDKIREIFLQNNINKIYDLHEKINFIIQIDNVNTFDSINLKEYNFNQINQKYIGNIVFSAVIDFNKNQFENTQYFLRIKIDETQNNYIINSDKQYQNIAIINNWSDTYSFIIPKDYTKDILEYMYKIVADFNAYNKECNSANFYYLFQAFAYCLNLQYFSLLDIKNSNFINKSKPDFLTKTFGNLFNFENVENLNMEEYRRILKYLIIGYQNGGAWNNIKQCLKYLIGYEPELLNFYNFYPWILRKKSISDPVNFSDRNYYNALTNYYIFKENFKFTKNNNSVMLLNSDFKKFTFIVKSNNFFNRNIDEQKIKQILNILKPAYTKYILNLNVQDKDTIKLLLYKDDEILFANNNTYLSY